MAESATVRHLTFDEYLAQEIARPGDVKHELVGGVAYAMTGGGLRHSELCIALYELLGPRARNDGCRLHSSDARLRVGESSYYPDAMVVCEPRTHDQYETSPCLVVEVLSPSTSVIDRRDKLAAYVTIPSLLTYVIVESRSVGIEVHARDGAGWTARTLRRDDILRLPCPNASISVDLLYAMADL